MSDYVSIYRKRLNRYGKDYASRIEGKRAREFEDFLLKTPNRVDFEYKGDLVAGVLEQYKQDHSETQGYLLTTRDTELPSGTIITFKNKNNQNQNWMVWWQEQIKTSGYNRYVILKMSHLIEWSKDGVKNKQWSFFSSPGTRAVRDTAISGAEGALFMENNNSYMFITPYHQDFTRDSYLEMPNGELVSAYRVVEFDNIATPGVSYLTIESIAKKDNTPTPVKGADDKEQDFFWLGGNQ
jgi:hypothetical protein